MGSSGGKKKQKYVSGYRYYAGLQLAFCQFADKILRIDVGDKVSWTGAVSSNSTIYIDKPELFGGEGKEGGIVGNVDVCFGVPSQDKNPYLVRVLGTSIIPAFRGLLTLVCNKVMVSANNPYIKEWSMMAQRTLTGWRPDYANITASDGFIDMNPAHIVREVLTNSYWGTLGYPETDIDENSFFATALLMQNEGLGLSLLWGKNSGVDEFIKVILNHIDGVLYFSHVTGKLKLKAIRNDYTIGILPILNESNILELVEFFTPSSTDMVNQVIVTYVDRENRASGVTVQDVAGINRCGGQINSLTIHMPGFATSDWASRVASRELQQSAVPISTCTLIINRKNFSLEEGDCFVFNWPDIGVTGMVMRIASVEVGAIDDGALRIVAVRDTYGLGAVAFITPEVSSWAVTKNPPADAIRRKIFEMTWWQFVVDVFGDSEAVLAEIDNTSTLLCSVCGQPSNDAMNYQTWSRNVGAPEYIYQDTDSFPALGTLSVSVAPEVQSTIVLSEPYLDSNMIKAGNYAMLEDEWVSILSVDVVAKSIVVARGILDTIPVFHPAGAFMWFHQGLFGLDATERAVGEQVELKMLPATGLGRLPIGSASSNTKTLTGRMMRPYPPGNVKICGSRWPSNIGLIQELSLTWAHRSRILQTVTHNKQDEGDIGPEAGTTYTLRIYGETGSLLRTVAGISATTYTYLTATELADGGTIPATNKIALEIGNTGVECYVEKERWDNDSISAQLWANIPVISSTVPTVLNLYYDPTHADNTPESTPYWSQTVLAMPMDGQENSTNFVDLKGKTVTAYGNTKIVGNRAYFDGSGDYLTIPASTDFDFGTGDFTIECLFYPPSYWGNGVYPGLICQRSGSIKAFWLFLADGGYPAFGVSANGSAETAVVSSVAVNYSAWNHVA